MNIPLSSTPSRRPVLNVSLRSPLSSPARKRTSAGFLFRSKLTLMFVSLVYLEIYYLLYDAGPSKRTTPKRKVAAALLIWEEEFTKAFVEECKILKAETQKDEIPNKVWKDIAAIMTAKHSKTMAWEVYRAKFHQMNNYFGNSMLPAGGWMGEMKWPYYDLFCDIHDVPIDFVPHEDAVPDVVLTPSKKSK